MKRIERDEYFMEIAKIVAKRGTCPRASVGCVLVEPKSKRLVSTGYNGSVKGSLHCAEVGCLLEDGHCRRTVHAEINSVLRLEHNYDDLIMYCTHKPCYQCYKALVAANVSKVYFLNDYKDEVRERLEQESPVNFVKMD